MNKNILLGATIKNNRLGKGATLISVQSTQNSTKERLGDNFLAKLTNNQTFAVIIGGLVLAFFTSLLLKTF